MNTLFSNPTMKGVPYRMYIWLKDAKITFSFYRQSSHVNLWPNFIEKVIKICSFNLKIPLELLVLESAFLSLNMSYLP